MPANDIIIEFIQSGRYVKVTAVDARSGIEATIVGDNAATREALEQLALRKLDYVMNKQQNNT